MFSVWENYTDVPFTLPNGTTINVDEWRKEVKTGLATIRSGYMRIDNCPRFQVVVLFNNERVMYDRPPFRKFDDALEAANDWLIKYAKNPPVRRLTALPPPDNLAGAEPSMPKPARIHHVPVFRPEIMPNTGLERQRCSHSKLTRDESAELDRVVVREYNSLDFAKASLRRIHSRVSIESGLVITEAMLQQRLKKNNLPFMDDKRKAVELARPVIKQALREILATYPYHGAKKCYNQLNKTEHAGYRFKLVNEVYLELRKETNTRAPTHPRS